MSNHPTKLSLTQKLRSPAAVFYEYAADGGALLREAADEIDRLTAALKTANSNHEEFERRYYLETDKVEKLTAEVTRLQGVATDNWEKLQDAQAEVAELRRDAERKDKLFYLAAQDVIFFSTYNEDTNTWPDAGLYYTPCVNLSDTFGYACADGQRLDDADIDRLVTAWKGWGYDGVVAWASLIRKSEPIKERRTEGYYTARAALGEQP